MKTIIFDDSRWPLVRVTYSSQVNEAEFDELLELLSRNLKRALAEGKKTAVLYDATSGYHASAAVRKKQAEWNDAHEIPTRNCCAGVAFVFTSALVRGVLTAVLWASKMPTPYTVTSSVWAAEEWCEEQLARCNAEVRPQLG